MSNTPTTKAVIATPEMNAIEKVLVQGDLSPLTSEQRVSYYNSVCDSLGLNPLTKPFEYITLNGKLTLYATKSGTDQVRQIRKVSIQIVSREKEDGVYIVTARASTPDGRTDESTGVVSLGAAKGDMLANLYMKAETKAKRRVTLSICGLGMLDESEVEDIPSEHKQPKVVQNESNVTAINTTVKQVPKTIVSELTALGKENGVDWKNIATFIKTTFPNILKPSDLNPEQVQVIKNYICSTKELENDTLDSSEEELAPWQQDMLGNPHELK